MNENLILVLKNASYNYFELRFEIKNYTQKRMDSLNLRKKELEYLYFNTIELSFLRIWSHLLKKSLIERVSFFVQCSLLKTK